MKWFPSLAMLYWSIVLVSSLFRVDTELTVCACLHLLPNRKEENTIEGLVVFPQDYYCNAFKICSRRYCMLHARYAGWGFAKWLLEAFTPLWLSSWYIKRARSPKTLHWELKWCTVHDIDIDALPPVTQNICKITHILVDFIFYTTASAVVIWAKVLPECHTSMYEACSSKWSWHTLLKKGTSSLFLRAGSSRYNPVMALSNNICKENSRFCASKYPSTRRQEAFQQRWQCPDKYQHTRHNHSASSSL